VRGKKKSDMKKIILALVMVLLTAIFVAADKSISAAGQPCDTVLG